MTTKTITATREADRLLQFEDFPPRDDMRNWLYLYRRAITSVLEKHLADKWKREVVVMNEVPIGPSLSDRDDVRVPDMMVAFDPDLALIIQQKGFEIARHDKAPEFTLEVASLTTGVVDYTDKRRVYERYGNEEFWRFDPSGGLYHDAALAGDRLVNGRYERIPIEEMEDGSLRGYSEALGLYLCWEDGELLFYDPDTRIYLGTYQETLQRAEDAEARADEEAARADRAETLLAELKAEMRRLRGE